MCSSVQMNLRTDTRFSLRCLCDQTERKQKVKYWGQPRYNWTQPLDKCLDQWPYTIKSRSEYAINIWKHFIHINVNKADIPLNVEIKEMIILLLLAWVFEQHTLKLKMFVASELQRNCVSEQNSFASKLHFTLAEHSFKLSLSHITLPTQTSLSHICVGKKKGAYTTTILDSHGTQGMVSDPGWKASGVEKTSVGCQISDKKAKKKDCCALRC